MRADLREMGVDRPGVRRCPRSGRSRRWRGSSPRDRRRSGPSARRSPPSPGSAPRGRRGAGPGNGPAGQRQAADVAHLEGVGEGGLDVLGPEHGRERQDGAGQARFDAGVPGPEAAASDGRRAARGRWPACRLRSDDRTADVRPVTAGAAIRRPGFRRSPRGGAGTGRPRVRLAFPYQAASKNSRQQNSLVQMQTAIRRPSTTLT